MDTSLYEKLLNSAFRFVSYRPRSQKEIEMFLAGILRKKKRTDNGEIRRTIERLREYGHVDDEKFVSWWISQRSTFRPKGVRALAAELAHKGVERTLVQKQLLQFSKGNESEEGEEYAARRAISKRVVRWAHMPIIEQKKKVYTFLAQRGFSSDVIGKIVDEVDKKE